MVKKNKQKQLFTVTLGKKKIKVTKPKLEWSILVVLVGLILATYLSGIYSFVYNYAICASEPLEVTGSYYKTSGDNGYGIHSGSNYSYCSDEELPSAIVRDPSTKVGAKLIEDLAKSKDISRTAIGYDVYVPKDYAITTLSKSALGDGVATGYYVTTNSHIKFHVREVKKDSNYSYTNLCSKPAEKYWSGKVIGTDSQGREVCRTYSRYVTKYAVGINIGGTGIMLETPIDKNNSEELLNREAIAVFSAMEPYWK
jgi:hypothetical protein